jgi:hypothetical protein
MRLRWGDSAEKRRWMRSLAMLLQVTEDSDILKTDRDRESYTLVRARLEKEFEFERLTWPLDEWRGASGATGGKPLPRPRPGPGFAQPERD